MAYLIDLIDQIRSKFKAESLQVLLFLVLDNAKNLRSCSTVA